MSKMTRWGVGPIFAILSVGYGALTFLLTKTYPEIFKIKFIPNSILIIIGIVLLIIGIVFYLAAIKPVMKAFSENKLYTKGAFSFCRHPIYSSWTLFIVPSICIFLNSSIGLTTIIVMYILLIILTRKEDNYLEQKFGQEYIEYKNKVPAIIPIGIFKKN